MDGVWQAKKYVALGYEDANDAERLSQDPALRLIGSRLMLAGSHPTKPLFGSMVRRIGALAVTTG